ncbi:iron-sulfur cluster assembly accessory protein [Paenibacillaceae bacterium]|nr:iron-sulfur cluster assembly accessory protein [Paenibacillaceae bacterium]
MIEISDAATKKISEILNNTDTLQYFLRLGVSDGGCSGLSYTIRADDALEEEDHVLDWGVFQVVIDQPSVAYIEGVRIDYMESGMTGGFTIDNPNAKFTCGCGASFRTASYRGKAKKCD